MPDAKTAINLSLQQIGLGPNRIKDIFAGTQIFGTAGVLNSLELVHFIASLSEELHVDVFVLIDDLDITSSTVFQNIDGLCRFIESKIKQAA
ncbi:hypothetical protein [Agrobacterium rosae]|uniref:Carrier domain-containing protein n=1 Tax=Agrobacterium rosae TaxID=1972867 RepID=A0AAW9FRQ7_9HYPH|nr:hypothetical protein [Agrobacterium rosae]MDX8305545.1 hypothetical protein [Agrobacterium rosae]